MLRYSKALILSFAFLGKASAQELFVYSEPASNMPAKSMGIRVSNWVMDDRDYPGCISYHLVPEIMWGANKRLMFHLEGYFSSSFRRGFSAEGAGIYAKYRFYTNDKVYRHLRFAAIGRLTSNNADIHQEEIATNGHNTGYQLGLIGTELLHKTALSATVYYEQALNNQEGHEFPVIYSDKAINYSLSAGRLVLPKAYVGYKQTNMNIMLEAIGQTLPKNGKQFIDIGASVQFIFNSQTRLDVGYKCELYSNMMRSSPNGLLVRVEHLLFNVL